MPEARVAPPALPQGAGGPAADLAHPPLRSALFARYQHLESLRYDYPLVLIEGEDTAHTLVRPLTRIVDDVLKAAAPPDASGEAIRRQVLQLEDRIRHQVARGEEGRLSDLWRSCAEDLVRDSGEESFGPIDTNLDKARHSLRVDGRVIGCDETAPAKLLIHAWKAKHSAKGRRFRKTVEGLILRLNDILRSDHMKSDEAHGATALASSLGSNDDGTIDFQALSTVLHRVRPQDRLPEARVRRIKSALEVLQSQAFFGPGRASQSSPARGAPYDYVFHSCSQALDAHRDRLPDVLAFSKALAVAELEVENKYRPALHDPIFEHFDESDLTADQLTLLPSALICLRDGVTETAEIARAYEALASGLPITVVIQTDDILGSTAPKPAPNSFGAGTARLAAMAMGLNNAFVLQATSADLYRMREALLRGIHYEGPALFSIYSGATATAPGVPAYILAAAATESRAFPSFSYDPAAGADWAARFDLSHNPQPAVDWPDHRIDFEDREGQRAYETMRFTFADFAICDTRYARFAHPVARAQWTGEMIAVSDWLALPDEPETVQGVYVLGVDDQNRLMRVTVDAKIIEAARRCNDAWRRLQELAGINNSHALRQLAAARREREDAARAGEPA
ncbi:MAG: hypothetical protein KDA64_08720, partial [Rhodospirillaceae bacterium]|nr:hypothetical protein [Rhodospirillaceae bacterium]